VQVVGQLGAWKLHGDQRDVGAEIELSYSANDAPVTLLNPLGLGVYLNVNVEDEFGLHGGISAVTVTGPQLANISPSGQATTPSTGMVMLQSDGGGGNGESEWYLQVKLAAAGTSRMPLVENASGPRDAYSVMVTWNDNTTSGPYTLVVRGTVDPDANPSQVLAALPTTVAQPPPAVLLNPGTFGAAIALTFNTGSLPIASLHSDISIEAEQNGTVFEFDELSIGFTASTQTLTLCTPSFVLGSQVTLILSRADIQGADYFAQNVVFTP
jgi:hypothetical protein